MEVSKALAAGGVHPQGWPSLSPVAQGPHSPLTAEPALLSLRAPIQHSQTRRLLEVKDISVSSKR